MKLPLLLRRIHLWLGCLFAPVLIFFAITGALQTLGWTNWVTKATPVPALPAAQRVIVEMSQGHVASRWPFVEDADGDLEYRPFSLVKGDAKTLPYSLFVTLMAFGLVTTAGLGVWMAYRFGGSAKIVTVLLAAGIVAPFVLYKLRG